MIFVSTKIFTKFCHYSFNITGIKIRVTNIYRFSENLHKMLNFKIFNYSFWYIYSIFRVIQ